MRGGTIAFLVCRPLLDSLYGRCAVVALVVLSTFCAFGIAFMIYVLIGTQRDLNRERRAKTLDQKPSSKHLWR
jgi:hypothetical protein